MLSFGFAHVLCLVLACRIVSCKSPLYMDGSPVGCEEKGLIYDVYQPMPADFPCQTCLCNRDLRKECDDKSKYCATDLRCVDQAYDDESCCNYCPNGSNCWLNGRIVSACGTIYEKSTDPYCKEHCECPAAIAYEMYGNQTQAFCMRMCA